MTTDRSVIEFDHHSAEYAADPVSVYREMRSRCPVAWTEAHDGFWVASGLRVAAPSPGSV